MPPTLMLRAWAAAAATACSQAPSRCAGCEMHGMHAKSCPHVHHRGVAASCTHSCNACGPPTLQVQKGVWNSVVMRVRLNTPGRADGVAGLGVNGQYRSFDRMVWRTQADTLITQVGAACLLPAGLGRGWLGVVRRCGWGLGGGLHALPY